jgi:cytochrome b561
MKKTAIWDTRKRDARTRGRLQLAEIVGSKRQQFFLYVFFVFIFIFGQLTASISQKSCIVIFYLGNFLGKWLSSP